MISNIILAFVLPWFIGILHLLKKDKLLLILIAPFSSVISYFVNTIAYYFGFWEVTPFPKQKNLASLPFELGFYPILACYLVFFIRTSKNPYFVVVFMSLLTTLLELICYYLEWIIYENGWNIYLTFFSYLFPFLIVYWYYKYLIKPYILL
ncbi:CBO0543 family protein [Lysinibacillus xylanilyticus]|uniref:CBO0543 family protein n=1 Tax=Lysinibacillus xylanilyticus TaxID=582475 RepID=UPI0036DF8512